MFRNLTGLEENGQRSDFLRLLRVVVVAQSLGLFALVGWVINLSYTAGVRSTQLEVNSRMIEQLNQFGSLGTKARLDSLDRDLTAISEQILHLQDQVLSISKAK